MEPPSSLHYLSQLHLRLPADAYMCMEVSSCRPYDGGGLQVTVTDVHEASHLVGKGSATLLLDDTWTAAVHPFLQQVNDGPRLVVLCSGFDVVSTASERRQLFIGCTTGNARLEIRSMLDMVMGRSGFIFTQDKHNQVRWQVTSSAVASATGTVKADLEGLRLCPLRMIQASFKGYVLYGIVIAHEGPRHTAKDDMVKMKIIDFSCFHDQFVVLNAFAKSEKNLPIARAVGDIIRVNNPDIQKHNDRPQVLLASGRGQFALFHGSSEEPIQPYCFSNPLLAQVSDRELLIITRLRELWLFVGAKQLADYRIRRETSMMAQRNQWSGFDAHRLISMESAPPIQSSSSPDLRLSPSVPPSHERHQMQLQVPQYLPRSDERKPSTSMKVVTRTRHEDIPFCSICTVLQHHMDVFKFHLRVRVVSFVPKSTCNFCQRYCRSCETIVGKGLKQCPGCGGIAPFEYMLKLMLEDATGLLQVLVALDEAKLLLNGAGPSDLHSNNVSLELVDGMMNRLMCPSSIVECCIFSYLCDNAEGSGSSRTYRMFDTMLIDL